MFYVNETQPEYTFRNREPNHQVVEYSTHAFWIQIRLSHTKSYQRHRRKKTKLKLNEMKQKSIPSICRIDSHWICNQFIYLLAKAPTHLIFGMRSHQPQNAQQPRYIEPKPHKYTTKLTTHDTQNTLHQSVNVICTLLFLLALLHFQFGLRLWLGSKVKTNFNSNGNKKKHKNCSCNSSDNNNNKRTRIYTHVFFVNLGFGHK